MEHNIVLYTKEACSYCTRAKLLLADRNIPFHVQKLNEDFTKEILLETYPTARTFPVVVVDGMFIGGFNELQTLIKLEEQEEKSNAKLLLEG